MSGRQWRWTLAALAMSLIVLAACTDRAETIPTPALTLATPAPAGGQVAQNFPAELVVILVTPTSEGGGAAEGGGGGQQVAQAQQATPGAEGGGEAQAQQATPAAGGEGAGTGGDQGGQGEQAQADSGSAGQMSEDELISTGEQVYTANCASCHQPNGQGTSAYPALSGNQFVTAEDPSQVIQVVQQGRGEMPSFGESLSGEQIAAVVSYIRNAWENNASTVSVEQVAGGGQDQQQGQQGQGQAEPQDQQGQQGQQQDQAQQDQQPQQDQGQQDQQGQGEQQQEQAQQQDQAQQDQGQQQGQQDQQQGQQDQAQQGQPQQEGQQQQAQATPMPAGGAGQSGVTSPIVIQIQIMVMTPEPASGQATPSPDAGEVQATPTPEGGQDQQPQQDQQQQGQTQQDQGQPQEGQAQQPDQQQQQQDQPQPQQEQTPQDQPQQQPQQGQQQQGQPQQQGTDQGGQAQATPSPEQTPTDETPAQSGEGAAAQATASPEAAQAAPIVPPPEEEMETGEGAQQADQTALIEEGEWIYRSSCAACHQLSGEGTNVYPALNGNELVTAEDPTGAILTVVHGRGQMPAFGDNFSSHEIAAVLSYVRNAWDNNASVVTEQQVEQAQQQQQGQAQQGQQQQDQQGQTQQQAQQQQQDQPQQEQQDQTHQPDQQQQQQDQQGQPEQAQQQQPAEAQAGGQQGQQEGGQAQVMASPPVTPTGGVSATAEIQDSEGNIVGTATLTPVEVGSASTPSVLVEIQLTNFSGAAPGLHGLHIHQTGRCEGPDFESAGDHFNPTGQSHGFLNPEGPHAGDLPMIQIDESGNATYRWATPLVSLDEGERSLLDDDGSALVIHEQPDDYLTGTGGGTGARIACGVITRQSQQTEAEQTGTEQTESEQAGAEQPEGQAADQQQSSQQPPEGQTEQAAGQAQATPPAQSETIQAPAVDGAAAVATVEVGGASIQIHVIVGTPEPPASPAEQAMPPPEQDVTGAAATPPPEEGEAGDEAASGEDAAAEPQAPGMGNESESGAEADAGAAAVPSADQLITSGAGLFAESCAACHQPEGQGVPGAYPPLAGNPFVTAEDPTAVTAVVLTGRAGMPRFSEFLEAEQIAAVVSYIRNAWGNAASAVTPEQVIQVAEMLSAEGEVVER